MMNSPIQLISYVRSGTMLTWELFGLNFKGVPQGKGSIKPFHTHMIIKDAKKYGFYDKLKNTGKPTVYVLRDCRDMLVSTHRVMIKNRKTIDSFSEFLRGNSGFKPSKKKYPIVGIRIASEPIKNWIEHLKWMEEDWLDVYKYEYIKDNQEEFIKDIIDKYNLELKNKNIICVNKPVGVLPGKGLAGGWKDCFSQKDLNYFWDIVGEKMTELGYNK